MIPSCDNFAKPTGMSGWWRNFLLIVSLPLLAVRGAADDPAVQSGPPGKCRAISKGGDNSFPFDIFRGDIRFQCEVNGHKVHMLLDDGYMWDDLLFWGGPGVDSLGLSYDGSTEVGSDSGNAAKLVASTASGITVRFPNVEFADQRAVITPSSSGAANLWSGSEGQVSAMLFKHFVVDINFDSMRITLIEPGSFEYRGEGAVVPWTPMGFGPWSIPATLDLADGRRMSFDLLMDLGYNDQLQLAAAGEHNVTRPDKVLPISLGLNIQGVSTNGYMGRLPQIDIGGYKIKNLLIGFVSAEDSKQVPAEAMIGLGLLSRFNLIYDYSRQRLIIKPNGKFSQPFEHNMSGLSMRKGADGYFEIVRIYDNSPANEAGLQAGDKVITIDGRSTAGLDFFELTPLLKREGATIKLTALRESRTWEVSLILRRLI